MIFAKYTICESKKLFQILIYIYKEYVAKIFGDGKVAREYQKLEK